MAGTGNSVDAAKAAVEAAEKQKRRVGRIGIGLLTLYLMALSLGLCYLLFALWPDSGSGAVCICLFGLEVSLAAATRLLVMIAVAGALGSSIHSLRSLYWYVGHRTLYREWLLMYLLLPLVGSLLGLVFYIVFRGGLLTAQGGDAANPLGFTALSALVGLFSEQAVLKLKSVAETVFSEAPQGEDSMPQERKKADAGKKPVSSDEPAGGSSALHERKNADEDVKP